MHFADQNGVLVLIRFLLAWDEFGHPHSLGMQPDFKHWCLFILGSESSKFSFSMTVLDLLSQFLHSILWKLWLSLDPETATYLNCVV